MSAPTQFPTGGFTPQQPITQQPLPTAYGTFNEPTSDSPQVDLQAFRLLQQENALLQRALLEQRLGLLSQQPVIQKKTFDNGTYEGTLNTDGLPSGVGKMVYKRDSTYEGEWDDGWRHGKGVYHDPEGWHYVGSYVKSQRSGQGVLRFPDGSVFEGTFRNDAIFRGKKTTPDNTVWAGEWRNNDFFSGTCTFNWQGSRVTRNWENGSKEFIWNEDTCNC